MRNHVLIDLRNQLFDCLLLVFLLLVVVVVVVVVVVDVIAFVVFSCVFRKSVFCV